MTTEKVLKPGWAAALDPGLKLHEQFQESDTGVAFNGKDKNGKREPNFVNR